nr:MAG TPA: nucleoid-associated protein [Caudoviricetes sp.]
MINIDLKNLNNEYDVGFIGEHNAEKLHIDISSLMSSDISFFVCVFCNGYAETYNSERYYVKDISDNSIDTVLSQSLTKTEKCKMVVGAYGVDKDGKVNLLQKSDIVNLHFLDSIDDTNAMYKPEVEGLYKELVDLENKFNNGLDLLESKLESIATATAGANTAATAATAVANDIKQKSENGYFNGAKGDKGDPGTPGKDGAPGKDGYTPIKGVDYFDGVKGDKGEKGDRGEQGVKGDRGEQGEQGIQGLPGTTVYSELTDKPIINGVTLEGDKSLSDLGVPTKISELTDDSDFVKKDEYASASQAGIIRTPVGCGISVDKDGSAHVDFPLREVTSKTDDIRVTHGSGIYILEFNSGKYAKVVDILNKQDKLSVGKGLKLENNTLTLDIPVATADTGYGG